LFKHARGLRAEHLLMSIWAKRSGALAPFCPNTHQQLWPKAHQLLVAP
jgi:hypothetical protein